MSGHLWDVDGSHEPISVVVGRVRAARERFLADVAGRIDRDPSDAAAVVVGAFAAAAGERFLADLYAVKLLEAVPGLGKVASRRILDARGVNHRCAVAEVSVSTAEAIALDVARDLADRDGGRTR